MKLGKALSSTAIEQRLQERLLEIVPWKKKISFAVTAPLAGMISVLTSFSELNSNNIGAHFSNPENLKGTKRIEREVIIAFSDLFHDLSAEGWITSGGSESNMTGLWIARQYLIEKGCKNIAILTTSLCHDSIVKAFNLLALSSMIYVPLELCGSMSLDGFVQVLKTHKADGLIVVPTVGASETGTCDPVKKIAHVLSQLCLIPYYIHVDASLAGLILPFVDPEREFDFLVDRVYSLSVDPHKMGKVPIGAGVFLCRKGLSKLIEFENFGQVRGVTLIGSRPGAVAAVVWYALFSTGKEGFQKQAHYCLSLKTKFIKGLSRIFAPDHIEVIHDEFINVAAIRFYGLPDCRLPASFERKYRLQPSVLLELVKDTDNKPAIFYRFKFMPHLNAKVIEQMIDDLATSFRKTQNSLF